MESVQPLLDRSDLDDGLAGFDGMLVVLAQPPVTPQPSHGALHHPATPQRDEPPLARRAADHHDPIAPVVDPQPAVQLGTVVAAVGLHDLQARLLFAGQPGEHLLGGAGVIDVGRRDHHGQQHSQRVHDDVPLAAADLLTAIGAHLLAAVRRLDRLAVDAGDPRVGVAAGALTDAGAQGVPEQVPGAVARPGLEVVVDGLPGGEVVGQGAPGTALAGEVAEGVDDRTHVGLAGSAAGAGKRDPLVHEGPLRIGQVGGIGFAFHVSFYANSPFWNRLSRTSAMFLSRYLTSSVSWL